MTPGIVFDLRRFCTHDGPGIRTAVFLKGCPLSCAWCHNPESRAFEPEQVFRPERCLRCGACGGIVASPPGGDAGPTGPSSADPGVSAPSRSLPIVPPPDALPDCPARARETVGVRMTPREVLDAVRRDRPYYDESGGGVTFTGGEPLAQPDFLAECLELCLGDDIATAVDTCGWASLEVVDRIAALAGLFLYDVKLVDPARHRRWTGVPPGPVLDNLDRLVRAGARILLRVPVIVGVNAEDDDMERTASTLAAVAPGRTVHLLPYHDSAKNKYRARGMEWCGTSFASPSDGQLDRLVGIFSGHGMPAVKGG